MELSEKALDVRWMKFLVIVCSLLVGVLLGIIGWVLWLSVTGTGASNVEILRVVEENNRQVRLTNCLLLVEPSLRAPQTVVDCLAQIDSP